MKTKMTRMTKVVLALMALNALSYAAARWSWRRSGQFGAELVVAKPADESGVMNYYVAGNVNQPDVAFKFMEDDLDGGITYVMYREDRGCDMRLIARQVINDARLHNYKARVIGISIGDLVGRYAEDELNRVQTIAINPEPDPRFLKPWARWSLRIGTPIMKVLMVPCGWLSQLPLARGFSLAFLADQWWEIAYRSDTPTGKDRLINVICSTRDQFLNNIFIKQTYGGVPIEFADADHGNTVDMADAYAVAWKRLLGRIRARLRKW